MSYIKLDRVNKSFGKTNVVKDVSLDINQEEFLVLVGPSGCGKSTLLRMIAGLESIDSGIISIDGTVINDIAPKDRNIAMVFQNYALYPHMTVYENLAFGLKIKGLKKKDYDSKIKETATILGISELLERRPKQLSGGQKQRIAVGRAIVRNPKAFLFDEPLSNLDAKLRVKMRADLLKLHKQQKATSLYVTHDQVEAMTMADRVVVLNKGVIQQIDTPLNVYQNPVNLFVATFMGSPAMNILQGKLKAKSSSFDFELNGELFLSGIPKHNWLTEGDIIIGLRPEDISIHTNQKLHLTTESAFNVDLIEHMGDFSYAHIGINSDENWTIKTSPNLPIEDGDHIKLSINGTKLHFFDPHSSNRLVGA
jgi:multiple sugar transport system ATP-binding protein